MFPSLRTYQNLRFWNPCLTCQFFPGGNAWVSFPLKGLPRMSVCEGEMNVRFLPASFGIALQ